MTCSPGSPLPRLCAVKKPFTSLSSHPSPNSASAPSTGPPHASNLVYPHSNAFVLTFICFAFGASHRANHPFSPPQGPGSASCS